MNMLSPHLFQSLHQWRTEVLVSAVTLQAAKAKSQLWPQSVYQVVQQHLKPSHSLTILKAKMIKYPSI